MRIFRLHPSVRPGLVVATFVACVFAAIPARAMDGSGADVVLEWNAVMGTAALAVGRNPIVTTRDAALVNAAIFDAVNGIERRYAPILATGRPSSRASERAAAIQAAYEILRNLYPTQESTLTARRNASIAALSERASAIDAGVSWGRAVAAVVWTSRQSDGFEPQPVPAFHGAEIAGVWRRTLPANANGFGIEFATMRPWVLRTPSQFRPGPPPALTSAEYTADFNEVRTWGVATGSPRSPDQSELVLFWNGNGTLIWNRLAGRLAVERHMALLGTARLLARLHIAMADAAIACWDSKYRYVYWRPITAIRLADTDPNLDTAGDAAWTPWLAATPAHPEYLSGHSTISGAATQVLANVFGAHTSFWVDSDLRPGTRAFANFTDALAEVVNARVFGGIHFRTACIRGNAVGRAVADYVLACTARSRHDDDN